MSNLNVLVSGSGIAGSVFASCLLRAYPNASITIVERDPALRLTGASVDIRSSAVDIIKWMDAEKAIREQSTKEEGLQFVDDNDKNIATIKATGRTDVQSFTSEFEIFRGGLAKVFIDPIIDKVKIIYDETVDSFEQHDDGVTVTFTKSREVKKYDLLVAADGLRSKIRGIITKTNPNDHIYGDGVHVAYFTIKRDLLEGSRLAKWYNTTNGLSILLRPDPAGHTRGNLMKITASSDVETKEKLNKTLREGNESFMKLMEEMYRDVGWLAPEVLKGMRESEDFYCSIFAQIRSPILQDGRVVLLGDAGYATPGFGTSLAIIGGYCLAGELLNNPNDVTKATNQYEGIMAPYVKANQFNGDFGMQLINPKTWWGLKIRNTLLSFVTKSGLLSLGMTVGSKLGFAEKKAPYPDYPWPAK